jgi:hypothetical protein
MEESGQVLQTPRTHRAPAVHPLLQDSVLAPACMHEQASTRVTQHTASSRIQEAGGRRSTPLSPRFMTCPVLGRRRYGSGCPLADVVPGD